MLDLGKVHAVTLSARSPFARLSSGDLLLDGDASTLALSFKVAVLQNAVENARAALGSGERRPAMSALIRTWISKRTLWAVPWSIWAAVLAVALLAAPGAVRAGNFAFASIDGGGIDLADWAGRPILVVNTASQCAFTPQYDALQALYDRYREAGLVVLAVPSDDFAQELESEAEIKEFCEINFDLDLPMTEITSVRGAGAHPFYRWVRDETGFAPRWNFNKVLIGPDGTVAGTWGSTTGPQSARITGRIEALLR
jgi:glutathione peroxidase